MSAVDMTGYERVWADDFDAPALNPEYWTYDAGVGVWNTEANKELEYYTDRPANVRIEDGVLVIEARREAYDPDGQYAFTSARVKTAGRVNFQYGIVRARMRLPDLADGLWPAFWTLGDVADGWPQGGEIDIMEGGHSSLISAGIVNQSALGVVHWCWKTDHVTDPWNYHAFYPNPDATPPESMLYCSVDSLQDWHVWTMVWTDHSIDMYVDDQPDPYFHFTFDPAQLFEFTTPQSLLFNLAVGGSFTGHMTPGSITAPLPARMEVDYVEIWQKPGVGSLHVLSNQQRLKGKVAIGELAEGTDGLQFDDRIPIDDSFGFIYSWNNLTIADGTDPHEGSKSLVLSVPNGGDWYGGGFQTLSNYLNFQRFAGGDVVVDLKTSTQTAFRIGIGSMVTGNGEVTFAAGEEKWGLVRDGQWHTVRIPVGAFGGKVDLATVNVLFYIVADAPGQAPTFEIDNLYWDETHNQPKPENGSYGIFTETPANMTAGSFSMDVDGTLFIWENTLGDGPATAPSEGATDWSFTTKPGLNWWGLGLYSYRPLNLTAFENGTLHFDLKTTSATPFMVGIKSSLSANVGQVWIHFDGAGSDPYGFVRDGEWHTVDIPVQDLLAVGNLDLYEIVQVFELLSTKGASTFAVDNIYFSGGGTAKPDRYEATAPSTWAGYTKTAAGDVDTGPFLGWINASFGDYVWIYDLGAWAYLPQEFVTAGGTWCYVFKGQ